MITHILGAKGLPSPTTTQGSPARGMNASARNCTCSLQTDTQKRAPCDSSSIAARHMTRRQCSVLGGATQRGVEHKWEGGGSKTYEHEKTAGLSRARAQACAHPDKGGAASIASSPSCSHTTHTHTCFYVQMQRTSMVCMCLRQPAPSLTVRMRGSSWSSVLNF